MIIKEYVTTERSTTLKSREKLQIGNYESGKLTLWASFQNLWRYRELIKRLTLKDLKLRYKNSFMGFLWSLVNPLLMMGVYYVVFKVILPVAVPTNCSTTYTDACLIADKFTAFILVGVLAWNFTAGSLTGGMTSLLGGASMIKKVYFPREVLAISTVLALFINFLLALIPMMAVLLFNGIPVSGLILLLPVILFFHLVMMMGFAMFLSSALVYLRDLAHVMDVIITGWFFLTPVFYSMKQVFPTAVQIMYWLNPVASFIESYRAILFFQYPPDVFFLVRTFITAIIIFLLGYIFFLKTTRSLGEVL